MTDMTDFDSLIDKLASNAVPVRARSVRTGRLALAALSVATLLAVLGTYGFRSDVLTGELPPMRALASGLMLLLACAAGGSAIRMARPQVGAASSGAPWALAALLLIPAIALAGIIAHPAELAGLAAGPGLRCLGFGLGAGFAAFVFLVIWLRRGAPVAPERAAWLAGLAAGAVGAFAVTLECPANSLVHIGVWHVAVPLVAGAAARLVLPRFLHW